jgi:hypothetical protein
MSEVSSPGRRALAIELAVCAVLVVAMSLYALSRMNYLSSATRHEVLQTDSARTAYVAKNIAEGKGYTANDMPAFLIDFYDRHDKLHRDDWVNADRFPFTAYATAALFKVTGQHTYEMGILGYNLICFVVLMVLVYWLARSVWNDKWAGLFALLVAFTHPLTYNYLYFKDGDMMILTAGLLAAFYGQLRKGDAPMSWRRALVVGTLLAWLILARPNVGGGFLVYFAATIVRRLFRVWRAEGVVAALQSFARHEGVAAAAVVAWVLPFVIHSLSEWGRPFFSANAMYQEPLGTRFAMDTDTWWKYSEPGHMPTLATLVAKAPDQMIAKFTTSWVATLQTLLFQWPLELLSALGFFAWYIRRPKPEGEPTAEQQDAESRRVAVRRLGAMFGLTMLINFALLPLYGYQGYGYGHYLSFFLPLAWILCGRALVIAVDLVKPVARQGLDKLRASPGIVLGVAFLALLAWNVGVRSIDSNQLAVRSEAFIAKHWRGVLIACGVALFYRPLLRWRSFPRAIAITCVIAFILYRPNSYVKHLNLEWFPADLSVFDTLRERHGIVASLSPQGTVPWLTDRKNVLAPELPMHLYSFLYDHKLEIEDVYLESAENLVSPIDGIFPGAAPGFEGYARLEKYTGKLPGYEIVFHKTALKGYSRYLVKPRQKASTVYRLSNRDAVLAMAHSPDRIELGSVDNVIYTAHGWGDYFTLDGRLAVAATDVTRSRYATDAPMRPWEDTSVTFFLDDRRPTSIDLDIYAVHATTLQFYWNNDLYFYDDVAGRKTHEIGSYAATSPGWQRVHLDVPNKVTRKGLNKLGFRASSIEAVTVCPPATSDATCAALTASPPGPNDPPVVAHVVRDTTATTATPMNASVFVATLQFNYSP